jgi:uncharacterized membrane protein
MVETAKKSDDGLMAALAYFLAPLTSIVIYLVYKEKGNKFVLFHAVQSAIFGVALCIIGFGWGFLNMVLSIFTSGIAGLCMLPISLLLMVASVGSWLFLMFKAFKGEKFMLPVIGSMADKYV